ncbi:hypothetical protein QOT17_007252 [Balamuthia mandrillaris]
MNNTDSIREADELLEALLKDYQEPAAATPPVRQFNAPFRSPSSPSSSMSSLPAFQQQQQPQQNTASTLPKQTTQAPPSPASSLPPATKDPAPAQEESDDEDESKDDSEDENKKEQSSRNSPSPSKKKRSSAVSSVKKSLTLRRKKKSKEKEGDSSEEDSPKREEELKRSGTLRNANQSSGLQQQKSSSGKSSADSSEGIEVESSFIQASDRSRFAQSPVMREARLAVMSMRKLEACAHDSNVGIEDFLVAARQTVGSFTVLFEKLTNQGREDLISTLKMCSVKLISSGKTFKQQPNNEEARGQFAEAQNEVAECIRFILSQTCASSGSRAGSFLGGSSPVASSVERRGTTQSGSSSPLTTSSSQALTSASSSALGYPELGGMLQLVQLRDLSVIDEKDYKELRDALLQQFKRRIGKS